MARPIPHAAVRAHLIARGAGDGVPGHRLTLLVALFAATLDTGPNHNYRLRLATRGTQPLETSLYAPVKRFLEGLGFEVKGEVCGCDVVALDQGTPVAVVIAELKLSFTLDLVLQAVDRSAVADEVWLAVKASKRGRGREADPAAKKLCRLLGFGLMAVFPSGLVEVIVAPEAWKPRHDAKRRSRIVSEHRRRRGDPTSGGSTKLPIMTAYRQQALACAAIMAVAPARPRDLKATLPDAPKILQRNVYGWFVRAERGVYALTDAGRAALVQWQAHLPDEPVSARAKALEVVG